MKKILFAVLVVAATQVSAQQINNKPMAVKKTKVTGYGSLSAQFSKFAGKNAIFTGAYGGVMLNHRLMIGAGAYALTNQIKGYGVNTSSHKQNNWKMGYGGLMLEYTVQETKNIHFTANTLLGGGIVKNGKGRGTIPENGSDELRDVDASGFYVVHPSVNIELIAARNIRLAAGAGYRFIAGSDQPGITNAAMSAPTASLTFKYGLF